MYENQDYPFESLVEKIVVKRDLSRNPVFDVFFVVQNIGTGKFEMDDIEIQAYGIENKTSKFDIFLEVWEDIGKLTCYIEYCTDLFKKSTIERLGKHFKELAKNVLWNEKAHLKNMEAITKEEVEKVLYAFL